MKLNKKLLSAAIILSCSSLLQAEQHEFSGNVTLTSDYVWRGVSQSDEDPAIQGGFDYNHESGFYVGTWASNGDFGTASIELDLYAGFANSIGDFSYDVWYIDYRYPGNSSLVFDEIGFSVGYDLGILSLSGSISTNEIIVEDKKTGTYYEFGIDVPAGPVTLSGHIGTYDLKSGTDDYTDWKLGASYEFSGFTFDLSYTDTDIHGSDIDDDRVTFSISKSL